MCFRIPNPPKIVDFFRARVARWASHQLSAAAPPTFAKFRARWRAPNFFKNFRESLARAYFSCEHANFPKGKSAGCAEQADSKVESASRGEAEGGRPTSLRVSHLTRLADSAVAAAR